MMYTDVCGLHFDRHVNKNRLLVFNMHSMLLKNIMKKELSKHATNY